MTLGRRILKTVNSPSKSPKLSNSSLRKRALIKTLGSNVNIGAPSKANLKVVVRVRPENQRERNSNGSTVVDIVDDNMLIFDPQHKEDDFFYQGTRQRFRDIGKKQCKEQKFMFERVFNPDVQNEEIFENTSKDIIETLMNGYNCSVFAYGATGSGKTYTMIGTESNPGITFLTVMELYKKIAEAGESKICEVGVSYLEVYNEMVRDLFSPGKPLNLHETGQNVQVSGLSLHKPKDAEDLLNILAEGNRNRSQHPTDANAESSRSHAVFQVFLKQQDRSTDVKSMMSISKLSMIDLAGSERGTATGFKGTRFREGSNINRSLLALGNCINSLADGRKHIPYRDSKLTRLLKDSLGGNCRSVMVATITKSSLSYEDTFNTLRYANRAKTIKMTLKNNLINVDQHVSQYLKVFEDLKGEISTLKEELKNYKEKEREWVLNQERGVEPLEGLSTEEKKDYEESIKILKQQIELDVRNKEEEAIEKQVLEELFCLHNEFKNSQRELLQLETTEREVELKIYNQRLFWARMNIFAFASSKLEKGMAKSSRSVRKFDSDLEHIRKRKSTLSTKLSELRQSIVDLCQSSKERFSSVPLTAEGVPQFLSKQLQDNERDQNVRDDHQIKEYLQTLVENFLNDQSKSEKLLLLLLVAVKHFYLKLKLANACDKDTDELLEKIYTMLDASHIEWADLKNTDDSFREQIVSEHIGRIPTVEVEYLFRFPSAGAFHFTPVTNDINKMFKRSNLKRSSNSCMNVDNETLQSVEHKSNREDPQLTPLSSRTFVNSGILTAIPEAENDSDPRRGDNGEDLLASPCVDPWEEELDLPVSLPSKFYSRDSLLVHKSSKNTGFSFIGATPLDSTVTLETVVEQANEHDSLLLDCQNSESTLPTNVNSTLTLSSKSHIKQRSEIETSGNILSSTVTMESHPSLALEPSQDYSNPTVMDRYIPEVMDHCYSIRPSLPTIDLSTAMNPSSFLSTQTLQKSGSTVSNPAMPKSVEVSHNPSNLNETFDLDAPGNETFCIPEPKKGESKSNLEDASTEPLTNVMKSKENLSLTNNTNFRKPGRSITPSKYSLSRLVSSSAASAKSPFQGMKRAVSGPSLPGAPGAKPKASSLKKSTSFLRTHFGSSTKNQENIAPKSVAFGSTYSSTLKRQSSKRPLNFRSPTTTTVASQDQ